MTDCLSHIDDDDDEPCMHRQYNDASHAENRTKRTIQEGTTDEHDASNGVEQGQCKKVRITDKPDCIREVTAVGKEKSTKGRPPKKRREAIVRVDQLKEDGVNSHKD